MFYSYAQEQQQQPAEKVKGHSKHGRPSYFRKVNPDGSYNEEQPDLTKKFVEGETAEQASLTITPNGPLDGEYAEITGGSARA